MPGVWCAKGAISMDNKRVYMPQTVNIPIQLYKSMQGRYFSGYADHLDFTGRGVSAWGALYNPPDSGVNMFVNVWTATSLYGVFRAEVWFNASMPGASAVSELATTSNFTIHPAPQPKVLLLRAPMVYGEPEGGVKAFARRGQPQETMVVEENGKFIFPPGGMMSVFLSNPETPEEPASGRVGFGWWEEPVKER